MTKRRPGQGFVGAIVLWGCVGWSAACSSSSGPGADAGGSDAPGSDAPGSDAPGTAGGPAGELGGMSGSSADAERSPNGGANPAMAAEVLDPNAIENVQPPPVGMSAPSVPSSGCGLAPVEAGPRSIEVAGTTRTFLLDVPQDYAGSQPLPLVFAFHGATTSGEFFRNPFYGNLLSAMRDEAIVVHADALGDPTSWSTQVDLPFFDAMLSELATSLCVDTARVFATGHSSGGFFTNTLGCQRGDVLRAIAPVSAGGPFGGSDCSGDVAVWLAHAENDDVVPFENGVGSRDRWLEANGCSGETRAVEPDPCVEFAGCREGQPVRWCVYEDGHNWPEFGPEGIWAFFRSL